jgi:hypothetical protein
MSRQAVTIDPIRNLAFGSISGTFAAVGTPLTQPVRLITFVNATDGDMFFSDDGISDKLFLPAGSFKLFDITTNRLTIDTIWAFAVNTQFYVRQSTVPSKGSVYIECLWGE